MNKVYVVAFETLGGNGVGISKYTEDDFRCEAGRSRILFHQKYDIESQLDKVNNWKGNSGYTLFIGGISFDCLLIGRTKKKFIKFGFIEDAAEEWLKEYWREEEVNE